MNLDCVFGQSLQAVSRVTSLPPVNRSHDEHCAPEFQPLHSALVQGLVCRLPTEPFDRVIFEGCVPARSMIQPHRIIDLRLVKQYRKIHTGCLPVINGFSGFQFVRSADHFIDGPKTKFRHPLTHFHCHKGHEIDHVRRIAAVILAQVRVFVAIRSDRCPGGKPAS